MNNSEVVGWLVLWAIELGEFNVQYWPRIAIKAQDLVDFITELTTGEDEEEKMMAWTIWTDGSSKQRVGGARVLLWSPEGDTIECAIRLQFSTTNNKAKYEAVLSGLDLGNVAGAKLAIIHRDSQVVVRHINGDYEAKGEQMKEYLSMVKSKMGEEFSIKFIQIPREENKQADHLAKMTSAEYTDIPGQVLSFIQYSLSVDKVEI